MRLVLLLLVIAGIRLCFVCKSLNFYSCLQSMEESTTNKERPFYLDYLDRFRQRITSQVYKYLPSPHSELFLGTTLGIDNLKKVPAFNDVLRYTGTIHVVVVSGFNISLVYNFVFKLLGTKYKIINIIVGIILTGFYSLVAGFEPPVIRSWIMGTLTALSSYYGYRSHSLYILLSSCLVMVIISPNVIISLSFQLSFLATLGILLYGDLISTVVTRHANTLFGFGSDFSTSLAAQLLVWPLISYHIGTVSIGSVFVNALVLWTISPITSIGLVGILLSFVIDRLLHMSILFVYPLLDIFVNVTKLFSSIDYISLDFEISVWALLSYYALIFSVTFRLRKYVI